MAVGQLANLRGVQHPIVDAELVDLSVEIGVSGERRTTDEIVAGITQVSGPQDDWSLLRNLGAINIDGDPVIAEGEGDVRPSARGYGIRPLQNLVLVQRRSDTR